MNLRELLGEGPQDVEVTGLAFDNRVVGPGTLFFCVPGFTRDGHDFAPDAIERGAAALVVQRPLGLGVPEVQVADVRAAMARAAARFHGDPTASLRVVGITGTNGKTTTAFLVRELLEAGGIRCGLMGTVKSVVGGVEREVVRTTPEAIHLQAAFAEMLAAGDESVAMEVSSHALELQRASAIHFAVALFTNLTQDHLDFHPDMEAYFLAKRRLFEVAEGVRVVNADDAYGRRLADEFPDAQTFGIDAEADWRAVDVVSSLTGSTFTALTPEGPVELRTPLPGRFNVLNALGAVAAARALEVPMAVCAQALAVAGRVPGRFEPVEGGQPFAVLVDYAHTPDSLENVLLAAREIGGSGRVICVFGAGGDRDRGKRPLMGEIAARLADVAIVTSDNPRSEDPEAIIDEVVAGASPEQFVRESDRRRAIALAVESARPGDVVVIAGKGHEQGQEFDGGRKEPFDDRTVAAEALDAHRIAAAAGAQLVRIGPGRFARAVIDSRAVQPGDLFVGLPGGHVDGGAFAAQALEGGAWGALVAPEHAAGLDSGTVLVASDPLRALQALARWWRRELGAQVIGVTGSVGKTSTKDLIAAVLAPHRRVHSSRANFNTEIGLPLEVLAAPEGTEVLVLEMGMRGMGQIAELAGIAEPDVGVITNVGPVHLELVGSLEGVALAKGELLTGLRPGGTAVVPAGEPLLEPMLRDDLRVVRFGEGGDVSLDGLELPFTSAHMRLNAMAAVAAAQAVGVEPSGRVDVQLSALRGERVELPGGAVVINDCYNANPLSMRAALDDLASQTPAGRRIAVLGDMLELGPTEVELHREIGAHAAASGVEWLVTVGPLAAAMAAPFGGSVVSVASAREAAEALHGSLAPGDLVLVKASRGVGLEAVAEALARG